MDDNAILDKLKEIVNRVTGICIEDENDNLLTMKYGISPADIVYILLIASSEMNFEINGDFIDAIGAFSLRSIADEIHTYV